MENSSENIRIYFDKLRQCYQQEVIDKNKEQGLLIVLKKELENPQSAIWDCLGEMVGVTNFDNYWLHILIYKNTNNSAAFV